MQGLIKFTEQILYLAILWKLLPIILNLLLFHRIRVTKHKLLHQTFRCIKKQIYFWMIKRERRLDPKISAYQTKSHGQSRGNVVQLSAFKKH